MSNGKTSKENNSWIQIAVSLIGAASVILVGYWQFFHHPKGDSRKFVGRVVNERTEESIRGAKITLEVEGAPPVMYTDSEGVFTFPLEGSRETIRLRVEADGYEKFDRIITSFAGAGIEQIELISSQASPEAVDISGVWEQYGFSLDGSLQYLSKARVVKQDGAYIIALIDQIQGPNIINSKSVSDVTYDGQVLTFKSFWSNGEVATARLSRLSDTIFEGEITVNGESRGRTRILKIQ